MRWRTKVCVVVFIFPPCSARMRSINNLVNYERLLLSLCVRLRRPCCLRSQIPLPQGCGRTVLMNSLPFRQVVAAPLKRVAPRGTLTKQSSCTGEPQRRNEEDGAVSTSSMSCHLAERLVEHGAIRVPAVTQSH